MAGTQIMWLDEKPAQVATLHMQLTIGAYLGSAKNIWSRTICRTDFNGFGSRAVHYGKDCARLIPRSRYH